MQISAKIELGGDLQRQVNVGHMPGDTKAIKAKILQAPKKYFPSKACL